MGYSSCTESLGLGLPIPCEKLCLCDLSRRHIRGQTISPFRSVFMAVSRSQVIPLVGLDDILRNSPCLFIIGGDQEHRRLHALIRGKATPP